MESSELKNHKKIHHQRSHQKGFALILFLICLPALITFLFILYSCIAIIQDRRNILNQCRVELLSGQEQTAKILTSLLGLNPLASALKMRTINLQIAIAAAIARGDMASASALQLKLSKTMEERLQLEKKQNHLFQLAKTKMKKSLLLAVKKLHTHSNFISTSTLRTSKTDPAIEPYTPGPAPIWRLKFNFKEEQEMQLDWMWTLSSKGNIKNFLWQKQSNKDRCAATIDDNGIQLTGALTWEKKDKF